MALSKDAITLYSIAGAFIVIGLIVMLCFGFPTLIQAQSSGSWPKTSGFVKNSRVSVKRTSTRSHRGHRRSQINYVPKIRFEYSVGGKRFSSERLNSAGDFYGGKKKAQQVVTQYKSGKRVDVFYNPNDPSVAVLEPGLTVGSFVVFGVGLLVSVVGLGLGALPAFKFLPT